MIVLSVLYQYYSQPTSLQQLCHPWCKMTLILETSLRFADSTLYYFSSPKATIFVLPLLGVGDSYVNPVCCVSTVHHQVRCMYWGHLGHFHRAISHLNWYKMVCIRYLACTFSQMKSNNMFSMFLQSGVPRHFLWRLIAVWIYTLTVFMLM